MLRYITDMKKIILGLFATALFCSAFTPPAEQKTAVNDTAVEIAIMDYLKYKSNKPFSTFDVEIDVISEYAPYKINEQVTVIDISPGFRKIYVTSVDTIGSTRIPTRHIIKNGKLFYWHDPNYGLTEEMVKVLFQFNIADSIDLADLFATQDERTDNYIHYQDDKKAKVATYYFCKKNLNNYKRVITNIATGWYKPPKLKCK